MHLVFPAQQQLAWPLKRLMLLTAPECTCGMFELQQEPVHLNFNQDCIVCTPGCFEVRARFLDFVNIFINDDFPTLDLPMIANSGKQSSGQASSFVLLLMYSAV